MTERNERLEADPVDRAVAALRGAAIPDGPPPSVAAGTVAALHDSEARAAVRPPQRRKIMFRIFRYTAAAAAVLLAVLAGSLVLLDRNASVGFARVVENVQKSKSVSFVIRQKVGDQLEVDAKMAIQGDMLRYEIPDAIVRIVDTNKRKGIELDLYRKTALIIDLEGRVPTEELRDPIDQLRNLKDDAKDHAEDLGDEEVDGRKCRVFKVKGLEKPWMFGDAFTLWADAKTGLPVKIHAGDEKTSITYEKFQWDKPLPEEAFSLEVPKDYLPEEMTPAVVTPDRIYYQQGGYELRSIRPEGDKPEVQFVPRPGDGPDAYVPEKSELSPDGRYLAMAYTHVTDKGAFPPDRVLLWDRTRPKGPAVEIYTRPEGELQSWRFSPDGKRLFVNWWEQVSGTKPIEGRTGTDVVDLKTKAKEVVALPTYKDADGKEQSTQFAAASADGRTYLVVGQGLHLATAEGKVVRRLGAPEERVIVDSVRLSPDGKQAVFTAQQADHSHRLIVVALSNGEPKELIPAGKFTDVRPRWSPDGKRIAFTCRPFDPDNAPFFHGKETYLKLVDPDGANLATLLTEKVDPKATGLELTAWR